VGDVAIVALFFKFSSILLPLGAVVQNMTDRGIGKTGFGNMSSNLVLTSSEGKREVGPTGEVASLVAA